MLINELKRKLEQELASTKKQQPKDNSLERLIAGKFVSLLLDTPKNSGVSYQQHLENDTNAVQNASEGGNPMAYERPRVKIGTDADGKPKYTRISGKNQDERNDNIVKAYVNSGRILEFIPEWALRPAVVAQPMSEEPAKDLHPFTPYAQAYYKRYKEGNRTTTHGTQKGWLKQACDFFGDEPIESIDDNRVQDFIKVIQISKNTGAPCTTKGIRQKLTFVGEIFNRAIKDKLIEANPCKSDSLKLGGVKGKGIEPLSTAAIKGIMRKIQQAEDLNIKFWLALMLYTGLRREEMLGLRWEHINFDNGTLCIEQAITYTSSTPDLGETKNPSSVRTLFMPDMLIETLKPYRQPSGYLVADENGRSFNDRGIKNLRGRVRKYTGLPKLDARELRHSYATMLNEAGIDMKAIGTTMGHTKVSTTEGYVGRPETDRLWSIRNAGINHILD